MTTEPIEPVHCDEMPASGFALLQLQLGLSNTSHHYEDDLLDVLMQQQALVIKSGATFGQMVRDLPSWAVIGGIVLLVVLGFYLVNFMLWAQRIKAQRLQNLEDAKKHSEHGNMLGSLIEAAIERFDEQLLGVNVDFGAVRVTVSDGVVAVHDLTLENPAGYWSPYFVHIGELIVDIDLQTFITSMGRHVVVERLLMRDVDVIWEGGMISSNLRDFLKLLRPNSRAQAAGASGVQTTVQEVLTEGMSLKIASTWLCGCGPRIVAEDFETSNFAEENMTLEVPQLLVITLLNTLLASVLGESVARLLTDGASHGLRFIAHCFWHFVAICRYGLTVCCNRRPSGEKRLEPKPSSKRSKAPKSTQGSTQSSCGQCGNCLPCEALLNRTRPRTTST